MRSLMHGRTYLLSLLTVLALAAPATAAPSFTSACDTSFTCLTPGQRASSDGVIVRWRVQSSTPEQLLQLRTIQRLSGGGQATTGTSATETVAAGATREFTARVPIGSGGEIALAGATGAPAVEADVENDGDGDGYGDATQDACPGDAGDHAAPCAATRTFGSPLHLQPDPAGFLPASGNPTDVVQVAAPIPNAAPIDGVITRWRFRAGAPAHPLTLQVLHPAGSDAYTVSAASPGTPAAAGGALTSVDARLAVRAGDRLGLASPGDIGAVARMASSGEQVAVFGQPPPTVGQTATPGATTDPFRLLVQADIEPDGDADGYGDVTQDVCPFDATRHAGCTADLAVTSLFSSGTVAPGNDAFFEFFVTNRGPDPAQDVALAVTLPPGTVLGGNVAPCPAVDGVAVCRVPRLAPGDATATRFYVVGDPGTTATATATGTSATPDLDLSNNALTWTATFAPTPPPSAPAPPLPAPRPCVNTIRGTRDDDALRGTQFGDRIVAGDGADFVKALAGDDCLLGGAGVDVLDGGDGADRLEGSTGSDRLFGGAGNDRLTGGRGNDRLVGGPGNDTIAPGLGRDSVSAGGGNDTINARDRLRETIDCGPGRDTVRADRSDRLKGCEKVTRR
jgi:uncharacterized repeat protein (TIGR01451 family)